MRIRPYSLNNSKPLDACRFGTLSIIKVIFISINLNLTKLLNKSSLI